MKWKSDTYWCAALEIAMELSPAHLYVLTPDEFVNARPAFWPVKQAGQLEAGEITAFVIPKDEVALLPVRLLRESSFRRFRCIYANEVFVIYSSLEEDGQRECDIAAHLPAFLEKRQQFLAQYEYHADEVNIYGVSPLPYILDTQKNRIFQTLFPHKKFLMEQFQDLSDAPMILKQEVVKYCVSEVRIELSSFCNRSCAYCPVSFLDRKDQTDMISAEVLQTCVEDLAKIDFDGQVWFCLFNEPLHNREFLIKTLDFVSEKLPKSFIKIVTNGDYLTADYFVELTRHRLSELAISIHYDGVWDRDKQVSRMYETLQRIGIEQSKGRLEEENSRIIFYVDPSAYDATYLQSLSLRSEDFKIHGMDRGGVLTDGIYRMKNLDHCPYTMSQLNITHDGQIIPCCNICADASVKENQWIYGKVLEHGSIFSAYTSGIAAKFRRCLFAPRSDADFTPEPCRTCSVVHCDDIEKLHRLDNDVRREVYACWLSALDRET